MNIDNEIYCYRMGKEISLSNYLKETRANETGVKRSIKTEIGYIDIYIYYPSICKTDAVYFNFHGGGFVLGYFELDSPYCKRLSEEAGAVVINVDYCLSPEYKFPSVYLTTYDIIKWCYFNANDLGITNKCFIVGGNSAGGNLAAGVIQLANEEGNVEIKGLVMNYPPCKQELTPKETLDISKAINQSRVVQYIAWQFEDFNDLKNPLASPVYSEKCKYPSTLINVAEYDSLRKETEEFKEMLEKQHTQVDYKCYQGCMHGFTHKEFKEYCPEASEDAWERISQFIVSVSKGEVLNVL